MTIVKMTILLRIRGVVVELDMGFILNRGCPLLAELGYKVSRQTALKCNPRHEVYVLSQMHRIGARVKISAG